MKYNSNKSYHDEIAKIVGVEAAVLFHSLYLWCDYNEQHKQNFKDGRHWTYQTAKQINYYFPYWGESKIDRMINVLRDADLIEVCLYNKENYDRTRWFAVNYKKLHSILHEQQDETSILQTHGVNVDASTQIVNTNSEKKIDKYTLFVDFLNKTLKRNFRAKSEQIRASYNKRIKDGWSEKDFEYAVLSAMKVRSHIENNFQYLTPEFFVRETTLNKYASSNDILSETEPTSVSDVFLHKPSGKYFKKYSADGKTYVCMKNGNFEYNEDGTKIPFEA